jgi:hypothetical protein
VGSAGFPIDGLDVFGRGDESRRLQAVARADRRRREAIVASYWQRYSAKNDTIGFFGPLTWGRIELRRRGLDALEGPVLASRRLPPPPSRS